MELDGAIDLFLTHLRVERALSSHTISAYATDLRLFTEQRKGAAAKVREISSEDLRAFLYQQSKEGLSARTLARRLASLRSFFRFALHEGWISEAPTDAIISPKLRRNLPTSTEHSALLALLGAPDSSTLRGLRDRAMMSLCYASGLRVSELCTLSLGDIDRARGWVKPLGKGNKARIVPMGTLTLSHIEAYLDQRADAPAQARSLLLFCGPRGQKLTRQAFWKLVKKYAAQVGLPSDFHPHSLRHAFATSLLQGGADLRSVQMLLGHSSISTTEIYTHLEVSHLKGAHEKAHPRG